MSSALRILLVDDDAHDRHLARLVLHAEMPEARIDEAGSAVEFAERLADTDYAVVIAEQHLGWSEGMEVLAAARRRWPASSLVLLSAEPLPENVLREVWPDLDGYTRKDSAGFLHLPATVRRALERSAGRRSQDSGEALFGGIVEALPIGIFALRGDGTLMRANPALARLLGFANADDMRGHDLAELLPDAQARAQWRQMLADARPVVERELTMRRPDEVALRVRLHLRPLFDAAGTLLRFEGALDDISRERGTEAELRRQAQALERYNAELEQLSYAVSHDLQEPLQLVARYARLLAERYREKLDAEAGRFIDNLITSADRMQALIDAVLEYSRLGTTERTFERVALDTVLDRVLEDLHLVLAEAEAEVRRDPLPQVDGDEQQLGQLFHNLLSNAVKFRGSDPLRVRIGAREHAEHWVVSVRDNGIGMEPRQAERIFGMFQRLHTPDEYPGTGIGLALCKKIVERHGGHIWARSQPHKGSTFFVSFPKHPAAAPAPKGAEEGEDHEF